MEISSAPGVGKALSLAMMDSLFLRLGSTSGMTGLVATSLFAINVVSK